MVEVMIASVVALFLLGCVYSLWFFVYRNWAETRVRSALRIDMEKVLERMKKECRLSSMTYMSFFPSNAATYTAISFPTATPPSKLPGTNSGFYTFDASGNILWDTSVIYHTHENPSGSGHYELRRTTFTNNNAVILNVTQRDAQLQSVVFYGNGNLAPNNANASTEVLIEQDSALSIIPSMLSFDGYSPTVEKSENIALGSARMSSGTHSFTFDVEGKNDNSSGYEMGIDSIIVAPSGGEREAEVLTISDYAGGGSANIFSAGFSGNHYVEFTSNAVGDYLTFDYYYDLYLESNFENSIRINTILSDSEIVGKLCTPKQGGKTCWSYYGEAGSTAGTASIPTPSQTGLTIRTNLTTDNIEQSGDLIRVKFSAPDYKLRIFKAYIIERLSDDDGTGAAKQLYFSDPPLDIGTSEPPDYGLKIDDNGGAASTSQTILAGKYAWTNWATFSIDDTKDYLISYYFDNGVASASQMDVTYYDGGIETNSYYLEGDQAAAVTWVGSTSSPHVYATETADNWSNYGIIESDIYDTKIDNPSYNNLSWDALDANVLMKARSSDTPDMTGASSWSTISGSSINPHDISSYVGSGRYIQFQATLTKTGVYDDYVNYPYIDNVTIDWPGEERICEISAYFTKKPDYGVVKLSVDGFDLSKGLEFNISVNDSFLGVSFTESMTAEIESRNTGR